MCKNINSTKETHYLFVKGKEVPVTKEVYKAYVSASGKFGYEFRKAKRYGVKIVSLEETVEKGIEFSDQTTYKEESIITNFDLKLAMTRLTALELRIIHLRFFEDYTLNQIAEETKAPLMTIYDSLNRSLRKLRNSMQ